MVRLAKYIAAGYYSRKAASRLIEFGVVAVNNVAATHITYVGDNDSIYINGKRLHVEKERVYLIYHKPVGIECICKTDNKDSIVHQINYTPRVFPVGRLDKDSYGLMLLTNDGHLCQRILHPDYFHKKGYIVKVNRTIDSDFLRQMATGVTYTNTTTRSCTITALKEDAFKITLTQGLNRQIRNICKALSYTVIDLKRIRFANLYLDELPVNHYRPLTLTEKNSLFQYCFSPDNILPAISCVVKISDC